MALLRDCATEASRWYASPVMSSKADKDEIRERIAAEIAKTRAQVIEYRALTKPVAPDDAIGRVSRMDAINNKSVNEAALRKAEHKLDQLEKVEARIDKPDFGLCRKCGQPIPIERILYRPESTRCVHCAS